MTNAERLLRAVDAKLIQPVELTLYGRAALVLGFEPPLSEAAISRDVDAVLKLGQAEALNETTNFWEAVDAVNREFAGEDLYISHFFVEDQVLLTPDWLTQRKRIPGDWNRLTLSRLGDGDLLLSKLMRDDPIDHQDALFIARAAHFSRQDVESLIRIARMPASEEVHEQFEKASRRLLARLG